MFRTLCCTLLLGFSFNLSLALADPVPFDQSHQLWSAVLHRYRTASGNVRYKQLKADCDQQKDCALAQYLQQLQAVTAAAFDKWAAPEQKAFLINAYNALTIRLVVDHYPVKSIRDIGGLFSKPWSLEFFELLGGRAKTLDTIEHHLLRPTYKDCRIHAAVNCASASCPQLRQEAYVGARLDAQLDEQMRQWLADPSRNQVADGRKLSKIFDWYQKDFDEWCGGVRQVVEKYGPPPAKAAVAAPGDVAYLDYDWQLNAEN